MATDQTSHNSYITSPREKRAIAAEAKRHDLSASKYTRLAVLWVMKTYPAKDGWKLSSMGPMQ